MDQDTFNKMFNGEFRFVGRDYPELKKEVYHSSIDSHECHTCNRLFYGYKHRSNCFDCNEVIEKRIDILQHLSR